MATYLIPVLNVSSKREEREWPFEGGCVRWVGWRNQDEEPITFGEARQNEQGEWEHFDYYPGRLLVRCDSRDADDAQEVADALAGLIDLNSGPWGMQLTPIELPDEFDKASEIVAEDVEQQLDQYSLEQPTHMVGTNEMHIRDEPVEWALDRLDLVLRDAASGGGLLAALIFLFVSHLEFAFIGDEIRWVLGLEDEEEAPKSAVDRVRIEESFHNCFKALEAVLGGAPPRDRRRLRARLIEKGIDSDEAVGWPGRQKEAVIDRVERLGRTRDKRSAHGGRTGIRSRKITFLELMDAQHATRIAIYDSLQSGLKQASGVGKPAVLD